MMQALNTSVVFHSLYAVAAGIGGAVLLMKLGGLVVWFFQASQEAREKGKRIEFGAMIAAIVAAVISLIALGVSLFSSSDLDARINALEKADKATPAPSAKPDQQEPRP